MFSGIIYHQATILQKENGVFTLSNPFGEKLNEGESVAHNGACMTVTSSDEKTYTFQAVQESLQRTNLSHLSVGDVMHVERSIRFDQRLDGHLLSGHIDEVGVVSDIYEEADGSKKIFLKYDTKNTNYVVEKGWIALDGVSLTVVDDSDGYFSVVLIPATQQLTHFDQISV